MSYQSDPLLGCGLMVVAGLSTLAAAAFIIGAMLFGVEWPVALLIIIGGAILTYWLLARMRRR